LVGKQPTFIFAQQTNEYFCGLPLAVFRSFLLELQVKMKKDNFVNV
jgi:hypothetical protein